MNKASSPSSSSLDDTQSNSNKRQHNEMDPFLSSMTFSNPDNVMRDCDCDECGFIPQSIVTAIRDHKRFKTPMRRTQDRSLVAREGGISIWKLVMPVNAEPLIEYGNSHRIVLVERLSEASRIKSIGKGIVGASAEEKSRMELPWKQGSAYFVPENGGKAIGWACSTSNGDSESTKPAGHVELYVVKLNEEQDDPYSEASDQTDSWHTKVRSMFSDAKDSKRTETALEKKVYETIRSVITDLESQ